MSVVLKPRDAEVADDQRSSQAISASSTSRINALGVAEPDITSQGSTILVQIPGVKDKDRALKLVGQTAELQFRPVLPRLPATVGFRVRRPTTRPTPPARPTPTATTVAPATPRPRRPRRAPRRTSQQSMGPLVARGERARRPDRHDACRRRRPRPPSIRPPAPPPPSTRRHARRPAHAGRLRRHVRGRAQQRRWQDRRTWSSPRSTRRPVTIVAVYELGPVAVGGTVASSPPRPASTQNGQWEIRPMFKDGADGIDKFNAAAAQCNPPSAHLPHRPDRHRPRRQVLDRTDHPGRELQARPDHDQRQLHRGLGAKDLATAAEVRRPARRAGAPDTSRSCRPPSAVTPCTPASSPVLVGLVLVALYMIFFYRLLGVLAMFKLLIEGAILWSIICFLGAQRRVGAHPGRRHRHHRVDRRLARLERRLLRAPEGRRPLRTHASGPRSTSRSPRRGAPSWTPTAPRSSVPRCSTS